MRYTKSFLLMAAAFAWMSLPAAAQNKSSADRTDQAASDKNFVTKAAEGGLAEVQMAQLAQKKAQKQSVKDLANRLYADHSKAGDELKSIAKEITWPTAMNLKQQREYNRLQALSGEAFDREYVNRQIKDHKDDIDMFEHEAKHGDNAEVKAWAAKNLPVLREHLSMAESALK
jgi:putative membrane protein